MWVSFRVIIKQEETVVVDTGEVYNTAIMGGKLGLLVFQQPGTIFSKLTYTCNDRYVIHTPHESVAHKFNFYFIYKRKSTVTDFVCVLYRDNSALKFDGDDDYLTLDHVPEMRINNSFTLEAWVYLESGYPQTKMPIICTESTALCMYIEEGLLHGRLGGNLVNGTTDLPSETWSLLIMRYDREREFQTCHRTA